MRKFKMKIHLTKNFNEWMSKKTYMTRKGKN